MSNEQFYKAPSAAVDSDEENLLPVADLLRSTFDRLIEKRYALIPALILPFLLIQLCTAAYWIIPRAISFENIENIQLLGIVLTGIGLFSMLFWGLLAVACHRVILDDDKKPRVIDGIWLGIRQVRYLLRATVIGLPAALVWGLIAVLATHYELPAFGTPDQDILTSYVSIVAMQVLLLPVHYLVARLSFVLPAAALGEPMTFGQAWQESSGNGWRLVILLMFAPYAFVLLGPLMSAGQTIAFWPLMIFSHILHFLGALFAIAALSLSYAWIMESDLGG